MTHLSSSPGVPERLGLVSGIAKMMPRLIASAWAVFTLSVKFLLRVVRLEGLFGGCSECREEALPTRACVEGGQGEGS